MGLLKSLSLQDIEPASPDGLIFFDSQLTKWVVKMHHFIKVHSMGFSSGLPFGNS
jgi:hypothetical protein